MLLPVPFRHQLLGKGVAIGPAFGIETRAGITVPVPGAADVRAGLEDPYGHAQFAQAVEHIHAGNPGADDDRVVDRELTAVPSSGQATTSTVPDNGSSIPIRPGTPSP